MHQGKQAVTFMRTNPKILKRALVLREAGYSLSAISEKTGLSSSTLYRHFKKLEVSRGGLTSVTVEQARQDLLGDAGFVDQLKHAIASAVLDDIQISKVIRTAMLLSLDELITDTLTPAALKSRSLAALSVSLKTTSDVVRRALNLDQESYQQLEELPTLTIRKMDDTEIAAVQNRLNDGDEEDEQDQSLVTEY